MKDSFPAEPYHAQRCCSTTRRSLLAIGSVALLILVTGTLEAHGLAPGGSLSSDSAAVVGTVDRFHRALAEGDTAMVLRLLTPDAVILESGAVETKEEYREHHLPGDIAFAQAVARERGPIRAVVRGDVAWATSTSTMRGEFRGRAVNSAGVELMVLVRTPEGWRISAVHWSSRALRQ